MTAECINPLRVFHDIVSSQKLGYDEKVNKLLKFGLELFGLEVGIVSRVNGDTYKVLYTVNNIDGLEAGVNFDLGDTYCLHTLTAGKVVGFHHVAKSEIASHPCYEAQKLEAYLGAPIYVEDRVYGTINFSSSTPVAAFGSSSIDFIELFAQWLGAEIARQTFIDKLSIQAATLKKLEKVGKIGTWSVDLRNKEIHWSEQTRRIHEASDDYVPEMGSAIAFYVEGANRERLIDAIERATTNGEAWDLKAEIITAKGHHRWVVTKGEAEFVDSECVRLFGTFQDITSTVRTSERMQDAKEKAEQATKAKSEFLANMSHEIRTPMNGVLGTLQLLETSNLDDQSKVLISKASYSATSLLTIINDILDYSKIEANQLTLESQPFSMLEVVESVCSDLSVEAMKKGIGLHKEVASDFNDGWQGDIVRVRQVLLNLVSNAVKFTQSGNVSIALGSCKNGKQRALSITVTDSGIGMSEEAKKRIFERFVQADSSTTRRFGGTGLGMSITVSLIAMMQGSIDVQSEPNRGTRIHVMLPLEPVEIRLQPTQPTQESIPDLTGKRVLVAEDNDINKLIVESMLKPTHAELHFAFNGREAVKTFADVPADIVLMDIQMPEMDGLQAFHEIHKLNSAVPVVALTANVMTEDVERYLKSGFVSHLAKPINMIALYETLRHLLISPPQ